MRIWLIFFSLCVMGLAYAVDLRWSQLSASHNEKRKELYVESIPLPLATPSLERRLVNSSLRVLDQSHLIFAESWRLLVGSSSTPNSAMKFTAKKLAQHLNGANDLSLSTDCAIAHDELKFNLNTNFENQISLQHNTCSKNILNSIAEFKWKNFETTKSSLEITFHPSQMTEAVGESLAMLNNPISCQYELGVDEKIITMSCQNLGLGQTRSEHYSYSKFEYSSGKQDLLVVEADHYQNLMEKIGCVSDKPCLSLRVPITGKVQVVENRKMGKAKKMDVVVALEPKVEAPVAVNDGQPVGMPGVDVREVANNQRNVQLNSSDADAINSEKVVEGVIQIGKEENNKENREEKITSESENPALQGLPSEQTSDAAVGGPSPELQPAVNSSESANLQSREPSGQESNSVLLPQR